MKNNFVFLFLIGFVFFLPIVLAEESEYKGKVFINEFSVNPDDWIELYNSDPNNPVNLTGWTIEDNQGSEKIDEFLIKQGLPVQIPANTVLLLNGILELSKKGEKLFLNDSKRGLVDNASYGEAGDLKVPKDSQSLGRYPDGGNNWYNFLKPTPGKENFVFFVELSPKEKAEVFNNETLKLEVNFSRNIKEKIISEIINESTILLIIDSNEDGSFDTDKDWIKEKNDLTCPKNEENLSCFYTLSSGELKEFKKEKEYKWTYLVDDLLDDSNESVYLETKSFVVRNRIPQIDDVPEEKRKATEGVKWSYQVSANDSDNDNLNYSLQNNPEGMTINKTTGLIEWPDPAIEEYNITIIVSDGINETKKSFDLKVRPALEIINISKDGKELDKKEGQYLLSVKPGEKINLEIKFINNYDKTLGHISLEGKGNGIDDYKGICQGVDCDQGYWVLLPKKEGKDSFILKILWNITEENFALEVKVYDQSIENKVFQDSKKINVKVTKEDADIYLKNVSLTLGELSCDKNTKVKLELINTGKYLVTPEVLIYNLLPEENKFDEKTGEFTNFKKNLIKEETLTGIKPAETKTFEIDLNLENLSLGKEVPLYLYIVSPFYQAEKYFIGGKNILKVWNKICLDFNKTALEKDLTTYKNSKRELKADLKDYIKAKGNEKDLNFALLNQSNKELINCDVENSQFFCQAPKKDFSGSSEITLKIEEKISQSEFEERFKVSVKNEEALKITSLPKKEAVEGLDYLYWINFSDSEFNASQIWLYKFLVEPDKITFDKEYKEKINWVPKKEDITSSLPVKIKVVNPFGTSAQQEYNLTIKPALEIKEILINNKKVDNKTTEIEAGQPLDISLKIKNNFDKILKVHGTIKLENSFQEPFSPGCDLLAYETNLLENGKEVTLKVEKNCQLKTSYLLADQHHLIIDLAGGREDEPSKFSYQEKITLKVKKSETLEIKIIVDQKPENLSCHRKPTLNFTLVNTGQFSDKKVTAKIEGRNFNFEKNFEPFELKVNGVRKFSEAINLSDLNLSAGNYNLIIEVSYLGLNGENKLSLEEIPFKVEDCLKTTELEEKLETIEDSQESKQVNLLDYTNDKKTDDLNFSIQENNLSLLDCRLSNSLLTCQPKKEQSGISDLKIQISANDGTVINQIIKLEVVPLNDPPVFLVSSLNFEIDEDKDYLYNLDNLVNDSDNLTEELNFFEDSNNFEIKKSGGQLIFIPKENWFGKETFNLTVSDGLNQSSILVNALVRQIKEDLPRITEYEPTEERVDLYQNGSQTFKAAIDNPDNLLVSVYWNSKKEKESNESKINSQYTFDSKNLSLGNYPVILKIGFGNQSQEKKWTVRLLKTEEKPKPKVLEISLIEINGKKSGKLELGKENEVEVWVKNNGNQTVEDVVVELLLENEGEFEEESRDFDLKAGKEKKIKFEINLPFDLEDEELDLEITAEGEDEEGNDQEAEPYYDTLEIKRKSHQLVLDQLKVFPKIISCEKSFVLSGGVINIGKNDENNIKIKVENQLLNLSQEFKIGELEDYSGNNQQLFKFSFDLSKETKEGVYSLAVNLYRDNLLEKTEGLDLIIDKCPEKEEILPVKTKTIEVEKEVIKPKTKEAVKPEVISFRESESYLALLVALLFLTVVGIILFLALAGRRK